MAKYKALIVKCQGCGVIWLARRCNWRYPLICPKCYSRRILKLEEAEEKPKQKI